MKEITSLRDFINRNSAPTIRDFGPVEPFADYLNRKRAEATTKCVCGGNVVERFCQTCKEEVLT